jgi:hypothetical protein
MGRCTDGCLVSRLVVVHDGGLGIYTRLTNWTGRTTFGGDAGADADATGTGQGVSVGCGRPRGRGILVAVGCGVSVTVGVLVAVAVGVAVAVSSVTLTLVVARCVSDPVDASSHARNLAEQL